MDWIIGGLATIPMEWYMAIVPIILLVLGFPIFIILLATASIVLIVHQAVPPMAPGRMRWNRQWLKRALPSPPRAVP